MSALRRSPRDGSRLAGVERAGGQLRLWPRCRVCPKPVPRLNADYCSHVCQQRAFEGRRAIRQAITALERVRALLEKRHGEHARSWVGVGERVISDAANTSRSDGRPVTVSRDPRATPAGQPVDAAASSGGAESRSPSSWPAGAARAFRDSDLELPAPLYARTRGER